MKLEIRRLPGPKFAKLPPSLQSEYWSLRSNLGKDRVNPQEALMDMTSRLPASVVEDLRDLLDQGLEAIRDEAIQLSHYLRDEWRIPAAAFWAVAWLEAAENALVGGARPQELSVLVALVATQPESVLGAE
jgi:hypothetical protein